MTDKVLAVEEDPLTQRALLAHKAEKAIRNELATQHFLPPRKFICLTNEGVHFIIKRRPVDQLADLISVSGGRDTDDLSKFFDKYGEEQACAMCLMLACTLPIAFEPPRHANQGVVTKYGAADKNVSAWATRMFFRLGGRPYILHSTPAAPQYPSQGSSSATADTLGYAIGFPEIKYSNSHNGFALYLARLLRSLWSVPVLRTAPLTDSAILYPSQVSSASSTTTPQNVFYCNFSKRQLIETNELLLGLKSFLKRNPQFVSIQAPGTAMSSILRTGVLNFQKRKVDEQATKEEQASLSNMSLVLLRAIEACYFLHTLYDHFPQLSTKLDQEATRALTSLKFKELVCGVEGAQLAKMLLTSLIAFYTAHNLSVEMISSELQEKCPGYFNEPDRLLFKASEALKLAKNAPSSKERSEHLETALLYFSKVSEHINLQLVCSEFKELKFYPGIVKLCLARAAAIDPHNIALQWHLSGMNLTDEIGQKLSWQRHEIYQQIFNVFDEFIKSADAPAALAADPSDEERRYRVQALQAAVGSTDELFHYALYQWYISRGLAHELLEIASPYLEKFLKTANVDPNLIWQYYYRRQKFEMAAHELRALAERKGTDFTLKDRIEYLTRAKNCISKGASGEMMQLLQEEIEVAQLQLRIYNSPLLPESAKAQLDSQLFTISELFNKFAKPYEMWEIQLAIIHASGHNDPALVRKIWDRIIQQELKTGNITPLKEKLKLMGREYLHSELVFPLGWLIDRLERNSFEFSKTAVDWKRDWIVEALQEAGVSFVVLFENYNFLFDSKEAYWQQKDALFHLVSVIYCLLKKWKEFIRSPRANYYDKRQFESKHIDTAIEKYITALAPYKDYAIEQLVTDLKIIAADK